MKNLKILVNVHKRTTYIYLGLTLLILTAFLFRLIGIMDNHSFWADEAWVSALARDILQGKMSLLQAINRLSYQPLHVLMTFISFKMFGLSEFGSRMPAVIMGSLGVLGAYLAASRLSNRAAGFLAAFLFGFTEINLAYSTQSKPYIGLETVMVFIIYTLTFFAKNNKTTRYIHLSVIALCIVSTFLHILGALAWIPYIVYLILTHRNNIQELFNKPYKIIIVVSIFLVSIALFSGPHHLAYFFDPKEGNIFFTRNQITYLREILWRNYAFITLPAIFGIAIMYLKQKNLTIAIIVWLFVYMYLFAFKSYTHNERYLVPFIGVLFIYFSVFWAQIGDKVFKNKSAAVCLAVAIFLFLGGYKIVRKPMKYYTPNGDLYGDVQVADYKTAYQKIRLKFPDLTSVAVFNDVPDVEAWYLPDKRADAFFLKGTKSTPALMDNVRTYTTLKEFLKEKAKYSKGLLIVEDWESLLPEDIKQYAKKNMKKEIRVEGLPQTQGDNWPIEVYSWGM